MVQSIQTLTLQEFIKQPETKPASEYIDGNIIQKPMPQGEHSAIQTELATAINASLKQQRIARAFCELRCTFENRSIVPDISVLTWERIPRQENGRVANTFPIAPDWMIEILSPEPSQTKVTKKILYSLKYGTQMGWLIDPEDLSVFVHLPDQATTFYDEPTAELPVPGFAKSFKITVQNLFDWLLE
ncbi:MAG: Uma2 family endonuclease [Lyngbya sp.]|nr:Uma2 family endonuclease [Lyngbya sp.]